MLALLLALLAQAAPNKGLGLRDLQDRARKNDPRTQQAAAQLENARAKRDETDRGDDSFHIFKIAQPPKKQCNSNNCNLLPKICFPCQTILRFYHSLLLRMSPAGFYHTQQNFTLSICLYRSFSSRKYFRNS